MQIFYQIILNETEDGEILHMLANAHCVQYSHRLCDGNDDVRK